MKSELLKQKHSYILSVPVEKLQVEDRSEQELSMEDFGKKMVYLKRRKSLVEMQRRAEKREAKDEAAST